MNNNLMDILEKQKIRYDSSGFWSSITPATKLYHKLLAKNTKVHSGYGENSWRLPSQPYYPSRSNWQIKTEHRDIIEVPLPRMKYFNLPFYSNFHLVNPEIIRAISLDTMDIDYFVYLFHLIEFVDLKDKIPRELSIHPNLRLAKEKKMQILKEIITAIKKRYKAVRTDLFLDNIQKSG
jgi:hypothetical protein